MSSNVMNGLLLALWLSAFYGMYWIDEWIDNLPKVERRK